MPPVADDCRRVYPPVAWACLGSLADGFSLECSRTRSVTAYGRAQSVSLAMRRVGQSEEGSARTHPPAEGVLSKRHVWQVSPGATVDIGKECCNLLVWLMLAQAQECAHIKAVADNKSPGILAKLAKQAGSYYQEAYKAVTAGSLSGHFDKTWVTHVSIKVGGVVMSASAHPSPTCPLTPCSVCYCRLRRRCEGATASRPLAAPSNRDNDAPYASACIGSQLAATLLDLPQCCPAFRHLGMGSHSLVAVRHRALLTRPTSRPPVSHPTPGAASLLLNSGRVAGLSTLRKRETESVSSETS
jgi:hypothetical protein